MTVAIVQSPFANLASVENAVRRLGWQTLTTRDAGALRSASRVILPGVGAAGPAMRALAEMDLIDTIKSLTQPVLGICLGMQLLFSSTTESGGVATLGIIDGEVTALPALLQPLPHMGWNQLSEIIDHPLTQNVAAGEFVYFIHSYAAPVGADALATCVYNGQAFSAMVAKGNFAGCQFHPERSSKVGQAIIQNFLSWKP